MAIFRLLLLEYILANQLADLLPQRHLVVRNGNLRFILLELILAHNFQICTFRVLVVNLVVKNGNFQIATVRATYWQINWQILPLPQRHLVAKNGNLRPILLNFILAEQLADLPPKQRHLVVKNGNLRFILLELILAYQGIQWLRMAILDLYCQSSYWQINWQIYPSHRGIQWPRMAIFRLLQLEHILADQLADLPLPQRHLVVRNGNVQIATVRVHIGRSTGRSTPPIEASIGQRMARIFRFILLELHIGRSTGRSTLPQRHLVDKNGNFQIATVRVHIGKSTGRSTPPIEASSGQEWQFEIYTVRAHIGPQGIQWLRMAIQICTFRTCIGLPRHLVVKNGNFRFILLELILADQLADLPLPQRHLVVRNGNFQIATTVRAHIGRINQQIYPSHRGIQWSGMAIFRLLLLEYILADQLADLPFLQRHLVVMNGDFRFILLELILADQLADLPLPQRHLVAKNGNFQISYCQSTYWQINWQIYPSHRGIQWPRMAIFRLLLLEYILANQLADLPLPQRHLVVRNGNLRSIL